MHFGVKREWPKLSGMIVLAVLIALLLSACQTTQEPSAEELATRFEPGLEAAGFTEDASLRVRFQEPVGSGSPVIGSLSFGLNLEVVIFTLDPGSLEASGPALAPGLSTTAGTVSETAGRYAATWDVSQTAPLASTGYVRVEIRPAGVPKEPVCNDPWGACLGYLDVRIVATGGGTTTPPSADNFLNVADHSSLPLAFKVLAGTASPPSAVGGLVAMAQQGDSLDETAGNCSSNDFQGLQAVGAGLQAVGAGLQAVGAGLQAVGAVGGLFVADPAKLAAPSYDGPDVTTQDNIAAQLLTGMGQAKISYSAALLVVDEFDGVFELPQALLGGADLEVGDLEALLEAGTLSHGALVLHQIKQLAAATTGDHKARTRGTDTEYKSQRGTRLLVRAVDAHEFDTAELAVAVKAAVESLSDDHRRIVVNMSFAVVPCAVDADVESAIGTSAIATFEEYVASLLEVNAIDPAYLDEVGQLVTLPVALASDPFFAYLDCPLPTLASGMQRCDGKAGDQQPLVDSLVHVAASGNFGNDYALYPAALPSVVSVGSLDADGDGYSAGRSSFSNAATVVAPGSLLLLADKSSQRIVYAGTSFAAPVVSIFAALDQMASAPQCDAGSLANYPSSPAELGGTGLGDLPLLSTFSTNGGNAVEALCN